MPGSPSSPSSTWIRVSVLLPNNESDIAEDLLSGLLPELGAHGLELPMEKARADAPRFVVATFHEAVSPTELTLRVKAALSSVGLDTLKVTASLVPFDDWRPFWEDAFEPLKFGPLAVIPSWAEPPSDAGHVLVIDPSRAFGTGLHPTTALCLQTLILHPTRGRVLDIGTGSGILALAALALGARSARGVDIDPAAVEAAHIAARRNQAVGSFDVSLGRACDIPDRFDLVFANLRPAPLIACAEDLRARLATGGTAIISGMQSNEVVPVRVAFQRAGLTIKSARELDGWQAWMVTPAKNDSTTSEA